MKNLKVCSLLIGFLSAAMISPSFCAYAAEEIPADQEADFVVSASTEKPTEEKKEENVTSTSEVISSSMPVEVPAEKPVDTSSVVSADSVVSTSNQSADPVSDTAGSEISSSSIVIETGELAEPAEEIPVDEPVAEEAPTEEQPTEDTAAEDTAEEAESEATEEIPEEVKDGSYGTEAPDAQMILNAHIVELPAVPHDFRFQMVEKNAKYAKEETAILEGMADDARVIAKLNITGKVYVIQEGIEGGWSFVESGNARGFIRSDKLVNYDAIKELEKELIKDAAPSSEVHKVYGAVQEFEKETSTDIPNHENAAFLYNHYTTWNTLVTKSYAVALNDVDIKESTAMYSRSVGHLVPGSLSYVISFRDGKWLYVESNDVRGFVKSDNFILGSEAEELVKEHGEFSTVQAEPLVSVEENQATYYSVASVWEYDAPGYLRGAILEAAQACVGNPYVWGGTDLVNGADCSGFVQTLYGYYGIGLPRVACDQAQVGVKITQKDAKPGDLVFYASGTDIYHVAIYAGDGKTIEAYSSDRGIINYTVQPNACWFCNVIDSVEDLGL